MFNDLMAADFKSISCVNTVQRRIQDKSEDLIKQAIEGRITGKEFSKQHWYFMQILLSRFLFDIRTLEHIYFSRLSSERTTCEENFELFLDFFHEYDIIWFWYEAIRSNGALRYARSSS